MNAIERKKIEEMEEAAHRLWVVRFGGILILLESTTVFLLALLYLLQQTGVNIDWSF